MCEGTGLGAWACEQLIDCAAGDLHRFALCEGSFSVHHFPFMGGGGEVEVVEFGSQQGLCFSLSLSLRNHQEVYVQQVLYIAYWELWEWPTLLCRCFCS